MEKLWQMLTPIGKGREDRLPTVLLLPLVPYSPQGTVYTEHTWIAVVQEKMYYLYVSLPAPVGQGNLTRNLIDMQITCIIFWAVATELYSAAGFVLPGTAVQLIPCTHMPYSRAISFLAVF